MHEDNPKTVKLDPPRIPKPFRVNAIGLTSLTLSIIAVCLATFSSNIIATLESRKIPDRQYETDDARVITDKAANTFTFAEQAIVFLVGGLVCGTLALVAFVLGCVGIVRQPRLAGAIGICLSIVACKIIFG